MAGYDKDYYNQDFNVEKAYLGKTLDFIDSELVKGEENLHQHHGRLIEARTEMWEQSSHYVDDFEKLTELNQHLAEVSNQTASYKNIKKQMEKLRHMMDSPYFGRFDFIEDGFGNEEKIYIGLYNLTDEKTYDVLVYDWRAPVCSIFYRYERGRASYHAPTGEICGDVTIKRQYKIKDGELKYFIDCSVTITDDILQEVLSRNSSVTMRSIVETIQREQDIIIRDTENDLLIVQGSAGSGKTSIALHRIAYLMYHGLNLNLNSNNIMIISPNCIFSGYISSVLPELGEENVEQATFDDLALKISGGKWGQNTRSMTLEYLIHSQKSYEGEVRRQSMDFKGSHMFAEILDRLIIHLEHRLIEFRDIYFDGKIIFTRQQLKNMFLNNKTNTPVVKRLKRMERIILDKIHPLQRGMLPGIEKIVRKGQGHEFEEKAFARLLSIKRSGRLMEYIKSFTEIDIEGLYKRLLNDRELFYRLSDGLKLPDEVEDILSYTSSRLNGGYTDYEDSMALLYLKLKLEGCDLYSGIRQVVVDEAQDYYPIQYQIFKILFKDARFTVLGDTNQSMERDTDRGIYDYIEKLMDKRKSVKLFLNKSYRSSVEINNFTRKLLNDDSDIVSFERHEEEPRIEYKKDHETICASIAQEIENYLSQGYGSIAVICKTKKEAEDAYNMLKCLTDIKLISSEDMEITKGAVVIPAYLSKGLEFDAVILYDVSADNFNTNFDRKLLYISCTRALHRLALYHTGEKSIFLE